MFVTRRFNISRFWASAQPLIVFLEELSRDGVTRVLAFFPPDRNDEWVNEYTNIFGGCPVMIDERLMSMRFELTGECAGVNLCPNGSEPQRRGERGLLEEVWALG